MVLGLNRDGVILFTTRFIRLYSYGFLSVGLLLYLTSLSYSQMQIGALFTGTLIGDLLVTFYLTTTADAWGRKQVLIIGALLKVFAGVVFATSSSFLLLLAAGIVGVISPTGGEIGPFLAVEQAAITESISAPEKITLVFGYYNVAGYLAQAMGAISSGYLIYALQHSYHHSDVDAYRSTLIAYSVFGALKLVLYCCLSSAIEPLHSRDPSAPRNWLGKFGLHRAESRAVVLKLSLLFVLDAFAGGFVMQTIIVYWFHERYQMGHRLAGHDDVGSQRAGWAECIGRHPASEPHRRHQHDGVHPLPVQHLPPARTPHAQPVAGHPHPPPPLHHLADGRARASDLRRHRRRRRRALPLRVASPTSCAASDSPCPPCSPATCCRTPATPGSSPSPSYSAADSSGLYDILLYVSFTASQRHQGAGTGGAIGHHETKGGYQQVSSEEERKDAAALDVDEEGQTETTGPVGKGRTTRNG